MSYGSRVPTESACDSTTSDFPVSRTSSYGFSSSPVEHSEISSEKTSDSVFLELCNRSNSEPDNVKGPDSTFNASVVSPESPPAYTTQQYSPLSENHNVHYHSAGAQLPADDLLQMAVNSIALISHLPVTILGPTTLDRLSVLLDPDISPSKNWKHMAEEMDFDNYQIRKFEERNNKTKSVIDAWGRKIYRGKMPTVGDLINILRFVIERIDVVTEISKYFLADARRAQNRMANYASPTPIHQQSLQSYPSQGQIPNYGGLQLSPISHQASIAQYSTVREESFERTEKVAWDNESSPVQDPRVGSGMPEYDAFILCNIADKKFVVDQFLPNVEEKARLKLCFAERDMPAGNLSFDQQLNYMCNRSRKLVVILSDEFFQSREHSWQSNLAISQDPASRSARIIVVKYKKLSVANIFDYLGCCDLTKSMKDEWFWNKIINGIKK